MTLPDLIQRYVAAKPGWRWSQTQADGVTVCHLYAPELEGRVLPRRDTIGQHYVGTGVSVETAFADALQQCLGIRL